MDLDASWGQGSSRRDFHFVTFVTVRSPFLIQDGLLPSKSALSTTFGLLLTLLDAVVLEKIQLLHLPKQQRICVQWSIYIARSLILLASFGILWHPLPRVVDSCGYDISVHCHPFQCRIFFPLLGPLDFTFLTRPPLPHLVHVWHLRTGQRALSEYCAIKALRIATRGSGCNSQLNWLNTMILNSSLKVF